MDKELRSIALYGYGRQGKAYLKDLQENFRLVAIIDKAASDKSCEGIPVITYEEYKDIWENKQDNPMILVAASGDALLGITKQLMEDGKAENVDYMMVEEFLEDWFFKEKHTVHIGRFAIPVTERCTLNCEKCITCNPYMNEPKDIPLSEIKETCRLFFSIVYEVSCINIVGGEPFLYSDLGELLKFLENEYENRIKQFVIITNGTVLPEYALLKILSSYSNIQVRVSDYRHSLPNLRVDKFVDALHHYSIPCQVISFTEWMDMGYVTENKLYCSPDECREHMLKCNGRCQWLANGRYYYCSRAWASERAFSYKLSSGDYLILEDLVKDKNAPKKILDFHRGDMMGGYSPFCMTCRGFQTQEKVVAAMQRKKR